MSDIDPKQNLNIPSKKELRDARRQAHEAQQKSASGKDGGKKGKMGKGKPQP